MYNDRILIPPTCRAAILEHLHVGHIGRDKMISLSRYLCWWPSINADVANYVKECKKCKTKPRNTSSWSPWPVPYGPMQRIHADYCGPFLGRNWILIVEDVYSKFPEIFITSNATLPKQRWGKCLPENQFHES